MGRLRFPQGIPARESQKPMTGIGRQAGRIGDLAEASRDFRQPLQTMTMLLVMLNKRIDDPSAVRLLRRLDAAVSSMAAMLATLHDNEPWASANVSANVKSGRHGAMLMADGLDEHSAALTLRETAAHGIASLTGRQKEVLDLVLAGYPSKNIAVDLGISQRTVDNHRAAIMRKTSSASLPALIRTALAAT